MSTYDDLKQARTDAILLEQYFTTKERLASLQGLNVTTETGEAARRLVRYLWDVESQLAAFYRSPSDMGV